MENYTTISLLVKMHLITEDAAEYLGKELQSKIHTARFIDSLQMMQDMVDELAEKDTKFLVEPWMAYIRRLELRITELEKQVAKPKAATPKK